MGIFYTFPKAKPSRAYRRGLEEIMTTAREQKSQLDKFKQAARELDTDDDSKRFGERLGKLVKSGKVEAEKPSRP